MAAEPYFSLEDVVVRQLEGPPDYGFDCGRAEQTSFLYDWAEVDQEEQLSATYLYYVRGMLAAYATVCMDALPLDRRERDVGVRFQEASALKLAQLGAAQSFQAMGLGTLVVADVIVLAREEARRVGCRYVTLDAQPDLVEWYERRGFKKNTLKQKRRIQDALTHGRDPKSIAVSMRYNLRER
jgi:GNAT superfamily N-acetyltransferase